MTPTPASARDWLAHLLDPGWDLLFESIVATDPLGFPGYAAALADARARTGCSEAVVVADGAIEGQRLIVAAFEFGFLGGSMGVAAGERICRAFERAAEQAVPLVVLAATGGARMQEGMLALSQMASTLAARAALARAHQPFIAYLRNPTTGGVLASFASTADLVWAEPGATIGFAGPRVAEAVTGRALPEGSHSAEQAHRAGIVDEIVEPRAVRGRLHAVLRLLAAPPAEPVPERPAAAPGSTRSAWEQVEMARHPARPRAHAYVDAHAPLRASGTGRVVTGCLAKVAGRPVVALAMTGAGTGRPTPDDYGAARDAIATAERLGLPIVTFVDTPGAEPGAESERAGIAPAIASTFSALLASPVPTIACITGEGGSGGALALAACDRILIQENAIFSVIAPEGAGAILRRSDLQGVAHDLRLTAHDLARLGLADLVVIEPAGGAQIAPEQARAHLEAAIAWALDDVAAEGAPTERRTSRWRAAGGAP